MAVIIKKKRKKERPSEEHGSRLSCLKGFKIPQRPPTLLKWFSETLS